MREMCVIGRPLSFFQALSCACAARKSFLEVAVALSGTPESRRQSSTSPDSTNASQPRKRSRYWPLKPPSREPRLAKRSSRPTWSSSGHWARNLPKLPCSDAISVTNLAFSRTDLIFCALRTIRLSDASLSQNSAGWNSNRLGLNSRNASSKPGHFLSITSHTKPAEKTRAAISDSTRSSPSLASALLLGFFGRRLVSTFSPPLRRAARSRIDLKETLAILVEPAVEEVEHRGLEEPVADQGEVIAAWHTDRLGAGNGVCQALRRPGELVAQARDHQGRAADRAERVGRERQARAARAGGECQPVFLLLVGEMPEAFQHRVGDRLGRGRFHRLGHRFGIARRLEDPGADARHDQVIDAAIVQQRGGERDVRAHRGAQQMRAFHAGMIHQREDVPGHRLARVFFGLMRLGALAVAAIVEGQSAQAL